MINQEKNVCYVIEVLYIKDGNECKQKFISLHSILSKRFVEFKENYFKEVMGLNKSDIKGNNGKLGSQTTISKEQWEKDKDWVMTGVTEREKCY